MTDACICRLMRSSTAFGPVTTPTLALVSHIEVICYRSYHSYLFSYQSSPSINKPIQSTKQNKNSLLAQYISRHLLVKVFWTRPLIKPSAYQESNPWIKLSKFYGMHSNSIPLKLCDLWTFSTSHQIILWLCMTGKHHIIIKPENYKQWLWKHKTPHKGKESSHIPPR